MSKKERQVLSKVEKFYSFKLEIKEVNTELVLSMVPELERKKVTSVHDSHVLVSSINPFVNEFLVILLRLL